MAKGNWRPVIRHCFNCGEIVSGYRNADGLVKMKCSHCACSMVCKKISRRQENVKVFAADGEELII